MRAFVKSYRIDSRGGPIDGTIVNLELANAGTVKDLLYFLEFFRDKQIISEETLTEYLIEIKLKGEK